MTASSLGTLLPPGASVPPEAWLAPTRTAGQPLQFRKGDGFDIYIDSARHLPDVATVSKVRRCRLCGVRTDCLLCRCWGLC